MRPNRRTVLKGAVAGLALPWWLGGEKKPSQAALDLIEMATADLGPGPVLDAHLHLVGLGTGGSGCWVNPHMTDPIGHPLNWARFLVYRNASGIDDMETADQDFVAVLVDRLTSLPMPVHGLAFAFDQVYNESGKAQPDISESESTK